MDWTFLLLYFFYFYFSYILKKGIYKYSLGGSLNCSKKALLFCDTLHAKSLFYLFFFFISVYFNENKFMQLVNSLGYKSFSQMWFYYYAVKVYKFLTALFLLLLKYPKECKSNYMQENMLNTRKLLVLC